jgi:hypothetical protein
MKQTPHNGPTNFSATIKNGVTRATRGPGFEHLIFTSNEFPAHLALQKQLKDVLKFTCGVPVYKFRQECTDVKCKGRKNIRDVPALFKQ